MTVSELAESADVSATTVLRLCERLGYPNYSSFKRSWLEASLRAQKDTYHILSHTNQAGGTDAPDAVAESVCNRVRENLDTLCSPENLNAYEEAASVMLKANRIGTLGLRSAAVAALYFEYAVNLFFPKVEQLSFQQEFLVDKLLSFTTNDVVLIVSLWPSTQKTVDWFDHSGKKSNN